MGSWFAYLQEKIFFYRVHLEAITNVGQNFSDDKGIVMLRLVHKLSWTPSFPLYLSLMWKKTFYFTHMFWRAELFPEHL